MLPHQIITASAGAGKTWSLTLRYLQLLSMGAKPESIIALTFSRKAAGEFFHAILHRLAAAAAAEDEAAKLAREAGNPALTRAGFGRQLAAMVRAMPLLTLGTMDSFFVRMARSFPLELGLGGEFSILDEHRQGMEMDRVFARVFQPDCTASQAQRDFLHAFQQATWGMDEVRLRRRLDDFVDDWHGLFLDAPEDEKWGRADAIWPQGLPDAVPREAWPALLEEARRAVAGLTPTDKRQPAKWTAFFDSLGLHTPGTPVGKGWRLLLGRLLALLPQLKAGDAEVLIHKPVTLANPCASLLHKVLTSLTADTLRVALEQTRGIHRILSQFDVRYHDMVRRQGRLTFQDVQSILSGDIAADAHGAAALSARRGLENENRLLIDYRLDAHYDHWLLDEFQDTSRLQWRILANLCDEAIQDTAGEKSFFAVGDEKQSIFVWRGAEPGLFKEILERYSQHGTRAIEEVPLSHSQRSGPAVISMVNRLFGEAAKLAELNDLAPAVALWPWQTHTSARPQLNGCGAVITVPVTAGESNDAAVWQAAADLLRQLQPLRRGLTCAVLCHRNDRATEITDTLRRLTGMEVVCESDAAIAADNPAGGALLALLKAAFHPVDDFSWQHVMMSPLGDVISAQFPVPGDTPHARVRNVRPLVTARVLRQIAAQGFAATLRWWCQALRSQCPALDAFSVARLDALCACAQEFDATGSRDADAFDTFAADWRVRESGHGRAIHVMTLHKSKGLTFDVVLMPDLHDRNMFQHRHIAGIKRDPQGHIEWVVQLPAQDFVRADPVLALAAHAAEAVRWRERMAQLYVMVTRARHANYILLPAARERTESDATTLPRLVRHMLRGDAVAKLRLGEKECPLLSVDGDIEWVNAIPLATHSPATSEPPQQLELFGELLPEPEPKPKPKPPARRIPLRRVKPSGAAAPSPVPVSRRHARAAGSLVHALFCRLEWADDDGLRALDDWIARSLPAPDDTQAAAIASVRACLATPAIRQLVTKPSPRAEVWRERRFDMVHDGAWISGAFDRVVILRDQTGKITGAQLIEFKTTADPSQPAQLRAYRIALAMLTGLTAAQIETFIVFVPERRVEAVAD